MSLFPGVVCRVLKGLFVTGWLCTASQIEATACTATTSANLQTCITNAACGDTVDITAGRYHIPTANAAFTVSGKPCVDNPIVIQASGWTAVGTGAEVFIDGTAAPDATITDCSGTCGWTQCTLALCGAFSSLGSSIGEVWYTDKPSWFNSAVSFGYVLSAQKPDGSPTYSVATPAELTNANTSYTQTRCAIETWRRCHTNNPLGVNNECTASGDTCSSTSPEIDSYKDTSAARLYVRWGTGASAPGGASNLRPFIFNGNNSQGFGFLISSSNSITIQGLTFRDFVRPAIALLTDVANTVLKDIQVFYVVEPRSPGGADYGLQFFHSAASTLSNFEIAYTGSEGIHTDPRTAGAMDLDVSDGWIHHIGDQTVLGYGGQTPEGIIWAGNSSAQGDYTGSTLSGVLFDQISRMGISDDNLGCGLIIESHNTGGMTISNNIFYKTYSTAFKIDNDASAASITGLNFFNNIIIKPISPRFGCSVFVSASNVVSTLSFFNNTIVSDFKGVCACDTCTGITSNIFRNNILYIPVDEYPAIDWGLTSTTNKFQNNLIYTLNNTAIKFGGNDYANCAAFDTAQPVAGGSNKCENPGFYDVNNFLFYPMGGSDITPLNAESQASLKPPTLDAGTATGMPAAHTTGIVNTLAATHGFGYYTDSVAQGGAAWDIGATESLLSYGNTPVGWTGYTPTGCSGGAATNPGTDGAGFVFRTQRDPSTLCNGVSRTLTLTVGQQYFVYFREKSSRSVDDITVDGASPPNYAITVASTCGDDKVDDWSLDATNATIEEVRYGSTNPNRGNFDTLIPHVFLLTPTSASVTLKAQVKSGGVFLTCPDAVYFFDPLVVIPIHGHCQITKYRGCFISGECPVGVCPKSSCLDGNGAPDNSLCASGLCCTVNNQTGCSIGRCSTGLCNTNNATCSLDGDCPRETCN